MMGWAASSVSAYASITEAKAQGAATDIALGALQGMVLIGIVMAGRLTVKAECINP